MAGLKIQVNGTGMIPRGLGLAPRKEPFMVTDIYLINLILNTNNLTVKFLNPETNVLEDLTRKDLRKNWDKYANYDSRKEKAPLNGVPAETGFNRGDWEPVMADTLAQQNSAPESIQEEVAMEEPTAATEVIANEDEKISADTAEESPVTENSTKEDSVTSEEKAPLNGVPAENNSSKHNNGGNNNQYKGGKNKH